MEKISYEIVGHPTVSILNCAGDLRVRGTPRTSILVHADKETTEARQEGDTLMLSARSDLRVQVPHGADIKIETLHGSGRIREVHGAVSIQVAQGDLILRGVESAKLGEVNGDLSTRTVGGDLIVEAVRGDMSARGIMGELQIGSVGRDLGLRDLGDSASAEQVRGDVRLRTQFVRGKTYSFHANGDIVARVPTGTSADLTLRSGRRSIKVKAKLHDRTDTENEVTGRMGDGGATVLLDAQGDLIVVARESDLGDIGSEVGEMLDAEIGLAFGQEFEELAEHISSQVQASMEQMSLHLADRLANLEVDLETSEKAARAAERAAARAQREVDRASERIRRAAGRGAERARRKAQSSRWKGRRAKTKPRPESPGREPVSDDERIAILNMVSEGRITVEEAESLLDALSS